MGSCLVAVKSRTWYTCTWNFLKMLLKKHGHRVRSKHRDIKL